MTRIVKILVLWFAVATVGCITAQAQNCGDWLKVTAWKGTYTLTSNGTGSSGGVTVISNVSVTATISLDRPPSGCGAQLAWNGTDPQSSGSINDSVIVPTDPCSPTTYVGGPGSNPSPIPTLTVDLSKGTYTFSDFFDLPGIVVQNSCGGSTQQLPITPLPPPWSWNTALPATPTVLSGSTTFNQTDLFGIVVPWALTWNFAPIMNDDVDDPCPKKGGSSIACQNQSLGEDVPVIGTGFFLHYEGGREPGRSGANSIATKDAGMIGGWTLNVHHAYDSGSNVLFMGDGKQRSAWQLAGSMTYNGNYLVTSQDGSEVYIFDGTTGRHLQTLKPLTGVLKYQFGYDAAGNLITVTDGSGNVTSIQRDGSEHPTAIVSPFSQTSSLTLDSNGFLSQVTDPAGHTAKFTNTSTGMITARTDANGNGYSYGYDGSGGLILDSDPVGGSTGLNLIDSGSSDSVTTTSALGRTSTYQATFGSTPGEQLTTTWPNGLQATVTKTQQNGQLSESTTLPDGTNNSKTLSADPRWGLQAPVPTSGTLTLGNLTMTTAGSRTATLGTQGNPFSLTTQTDTRKVNGRTYTSVFTASSKTYVDTTPVKRKTTTILDSLERISSTQLGALLPVSYSYDTQGRLATIAQGTRTTKLAYDSNGFLNSITDPLTFTTNFTHDADGRLLTTTSPDGRVITYTYDANGNVTSVTPPGKSAHDFSYTAVDLTSAYTPPTVSGTGATTYAYNADRDMTTVTRPDGEAITFGYDSAGRWSSATTPTETVNYAYDATTGNLSSASISGGEAIAYGYNGPLPTASTWTGTVAGSVSRAYSNNFWVTSESINNGNTVNFTYDNDGWPTKAGSLVVKHDPKDGLITGTTLGGATDARTYDTFGALAGFTAKYKTTALYAVKFTRDADGRITGKTETISGKKNTFTYSYDAAGRLTGVTENGTSISSYTYDSNSNRLTATTSSGTVSGTYDAQDRLLIYGNASYTYTANGELASQTVGSQTTSYQYDVFWNLIAANLPSGTKISYIIDPENNRVGKEVNGAPTTGFLYDGDSIVAQLNGSNAIVNQFIYASGTTAPDYMVTGGVTYRIFTDHMGSPRLVVNTSTGQIAEEIDYDEFGNVVKDTNPGFQPFGFAGGLYDQDTKLVRFGARDYNPAVGRWTAKDPILFAGGDTSLYGYVFNDPVNLIDPSGLDDCKKKKKIKKIIDKIAHEVTGDKITVGPVGISTVKPEVIFGGGAKLEVEGHTVAEATGKVAVGVTPTSDPAAPTVYVDVSGKVTVLGHEVGEVHLHAEGGDLSKTQNSANILSHTPGADQALAAECETNCK
jgi:RHS repeat-associated protein